MTLSRRDPAARRTQVLAEATRLFAERGYESTSVNDVAAGAGVSVGTLYKYFPDKPALLEAVLADFEEAFLLPMRSMHDAAGDHFSRLQRMVHGLFEIASTRQHFFWALTSGTHGLRGERPSTPGARIRAEIARFIRSGVKAEEFRRVNAEQVATLAFGVVETAMRHCFGQAEEGRRRAQWERTVYEMLASNVRPREES